MPHRCGSGLAAMTSSATLRRNVILVLLVSQITFSALLMRYSATHVDVNLPRFRASVAVLATEAMKLPICIVAATVIAGGPRGFLELMRAELPRYETLKCMVPALAFTLQSNLLFIATANLETPTFQVAYQSKTLFTALFSVCLLGRRLRASQWCALLFLFIGTVLAADLAGPSKKNGHSTTTESAAMGLTACFSAAMLSAFSSVYFEKVCMHMRVCMPMSMRMYACVYVLLSSIYFEKVGST